MYHLQYTNLVNRRLVGIRICRSILDVETIDGSGSLSSFHRIHNDQAICLCDDVYESETVSSSFNDLDTRWQIHVHELLCYMDAHALIRQQEVPDTKNHNVLGGSIAAPPKGFNGIRLSGLGHSTKNFFILLL